MAYTTILTPYRFYFIYMLYVPWFCKVAYFTRPLSSVIGGDYVGTYDAEDDFPFAIRYAIPSPETARWIEKRLIGR